MLVGGGWSGLGGNWVVIRYLSMEGTLRALTAAGKMDRMGWPRQSLAYRTASAMNFFIRRRRRRSSLSVSSVSSVSSFGSVPSDLSRLTSVMNKTHAVVSPIAYSTLRK